MVQEDESIKFFVILFTGGFALGIVLGIITFLFGDILFSIAFFTLGIIELICAKGLKAGSE